MTTNVDRSQTDFLKAALLALLVTLLWSSSWVLIKIGVAEIPALTFAGLRYMLAFFILLPLFFWSGAHHDVRGLTQGDWRQFIILGIVYYGITHGAQFLSLGYLPAITANLFLGLTPMVVLLFSGLWLGERAAPWQGWGTILSLLGLLVYFFPIQLPAGAHIGILAALVGLIANAGSALLGRGINRDRRFSPLFVTTISMGIGAPLLLLTGLLSEEWPSISLTGWIIIAWLAIVNTALAFTLWNQTLRALTALESSLINNSMSVQIPILAVLFLGESLTLRESIGLAMTVIGILVVQLSGRRR